MKAWLITWEWASKSAAKKDKVVAILNPNIGHKRIKEIVEILYAAFSGDLIDMARYAKRPSKNPYSAKYFNPRGVDYIDWITCGHHPYLEARKVDNLTVTFDRNRGMEIITWDELTTIDPLTKEEISPSKHIVHKRKATHSYRRGR